MRFFTQRAPRTLFRMTKIMNTICIIDGGGRGAALVAAYAKNPLVERILVIPGNDYMQENSSKPVVTYPHLKTTDVKEIVEICTTEKVSLVDVAQDDAVAAGVTDALQKEGIVVFGPTKSAGELEWSKAFSREFMQRNTIPQPDFAIFSSVAEGMAYLQQQPDQPWFVKASGLALGKGALPANNNAEAEERIVELQEFGDAGKTYLLEKWLKSPDGSNVEEFSAFAISDGKSWRMIGYAQDHKRALDADKGENTGGMGVSTPPLVITKDIAKQTEDIFSKTFTGLQKEGRSYVGVLYLGGMIVGEKVYVVEFNARWGDPEAEAVIPGIINDYYELIQTILRKQLDTITIKIDNSYRVAIAGTARGYPEDYKAVKGKQIIGLSEAKKMEDVIVFGAGIATKSSVKRGDPSTPSLRSVAQDDSVDYVVNGGRIFYVVAEGKTVIDAREKAYAAMERISIEGDNLHYRKDIGWRDVKRFSH
jgi:phosphoribosylamine--glycine ligase